MQLADPKAPVVSGQIDVGGKPYLYVELEANADIVAIGRLLLDEADRALANSPQAKRR